MEEFESFKLPVSRRATYVRLSKPALDDGPPQIIYGGDYWAADEVDGVRVDSRRSTTDDLRLPDRLPFSKTDILFVCLSIVTFFVDIGTDLKLAHSYYVLGDMLFFGLTLGFFALSGVVSSTFSMYWYICDYRATKSRLAPEDLPSKFTWFCRGLCAVLLIAPALRHVDIIRYGLKSRFGKRSTEKRFKYFREMQYERVDGAMLRLFECFIEDAPQLVLQLYIVFSHGFPKASDQLTWTFAFQSASIVTSLVSLAWGLVAYHKALRYSRTDRRNLSHTGFAFQFLWRLFEVVPRVLAFAVFMLAHKYWLAVVVGCHWVAMSAWLLAMGSKFCPRLRLELLFVLVVAAIWVFCHFNIKDGATRKRYVIYYAIVYAENALMAILWYASVDGAPLRMQWHKDIVLPIILSSFWIGIFFMLIYYRFFHPNRRLPTCLPCSSYWLACCHPSSDARLAADRTDSKNGPPSLDMLGEPSIALTRLESAKQEQLAAGTSAAPAAPAAAAAGAAATAEDEEPTEAGADTSTLLPPRSHSRASLAVPCARTPQRLSSASLPLAVGFQPQVIPATAADACTVVIDVPSALPCPHSNGLLAIGAVVELRPSALAQATFEQQQQQCHGDGGYLKPLSDGYCPQGGASGSAEHSPPRLATTAAAAVADASTAEAATYDDDVPDVLPPSYLAPLLPPPAIRSASPDAAALPGADVPVTAVDVTFTPGYDDDVPAPQYRAPMLPGTAAADDLTDLPTYRAPARPHSSALEMDDVASSVRRLLLADALPAPRRPLSALVVARHRSERPPALIAVPAAQLPPAAAAAAAAPLRVEAVGVDLRPAAAQPLPAAELRSRLPGLSVAHWVPGAPALPALSAQSWASPSATSPCAASLESRVVAVGSGEGCSSLDATAVTGRTSSDSPTCGWDVGGAPVSTPSGRLLLGHADCTDLTPDLRRLRGLDVGSEPSASSSDGYSLLLTPDRVRLLSDGRTLTPAVADGASFGDLTPETTVRREDAQLFSLRDGVVGGGMSDGDSPLLLLLHTPDRKRLAAGYRST